MPKKKIKRSVQRRFKITKTGKVLFAHQNAGHHKSVRSKSRIRRGNVVGVLSPSFAKKIKQMLGAR